MEDQPSQDIAALDELRRWYAKRIAGPHGRAGIKRLTVHEKLLDIWPGVPPGIAASITKAVMEGDLPPATSMRRSDVLANTIINDNEGSSRKVRLQIAQGQMKRPTRQSDQCAAAYAWQSIATVGAETHLRACGVTEPYTAAEILEAAGTICEHYTQQVKQS